MISVIVPVFNEEESLPIFIKELKKALKVINRKHEVIFVDDGSTDSSLNLLKKIAETNTDIKVFSFRKNMGKAEALSFGFGKAKGDIVVTLDADLQDRPVEISKLISKLEEGFDLVCGWRKERKDPFKKVLSSKLFNSLAKGFWGLNLHDYNCGLKVYTREAAQSLTLYGGMHRFIPLLVHQEGFKVTEVPVKHDKRLFGKSKYGFSKLWKDMPDIFTMIFLSRYGSRPFHFFAFLGILFFLFGIIILGYLSFVHFQGEAIGRRPLLFLGMLLVIFGFQTIFTGFLADLILNSSVKNSRSDSHIFPIRYKKE